MEGKGTERNAGLNRIWKGRKGGEGRKGRVV